MNREGRERMGGKGREEVRGKKAKGKREIKIEKRKGEEKGEGSVEPRAEGTALC